MAVGLIALLAGGAFLFASLRTMDDVHRGAFDSLSTLKGVRDVQTTLYAADDALDGFLETSDESLQLKYRGAIEALPTLLADLRTGARDPRQQSLLEHLGRQIDAHLGMLREWEVAGSPEVKRPTGLIRRMIENMDAINVTIDEFRAIEVKRLAALNDAAATSYRKAGWTLLLGGLLTAAILATLAVLFRRQLNQRTASEARLQQLNRTLEERVAARTAQLAHTAQQLEHDAAALREINDRLDQIVRHSPLGIVYYDADLRLTAYSPAAERIFGFQAEEVLGKRLDEIVRMVAGDADETLAFAQRALAGESVEAVTVKRCRKDGTPVTVRLWCARHGAHDGKAEGIVFLAEDITEKAALEGRLQLGEHAIQSASIGVSVTTQDARILRANPAYCRLVGYEEAELLGMRVWDVNPAYTPEIWAGYWADLQVRRSMTVQAELQHRDGHLIPVEVDVSVLHFQGAEVHLAFFRDMTARRQIEAQLVQAQKMEAVGQLAGGIAHDFNNLLAVVSGNVEMAKEDLAPNGELSEMLAAALGAAQRGAELTHRLLAFSRKQPLQPTAVDLRERIAGLHGLLNRALGETIDVQVDLPPALWWCYADPAQLDTTILNLAVNARDAMPKGGELKVAAYNKRLDVDYASANPDAHEGDYVCLEVSDTGLGMSDEVLARAFDPFFTTKPAGKGTGLGLSMVYGFVRQSGGHIKIYSELGEGTTVRIYLPAVDSVAGVLESQGIADEEESTVPLRILVVEDDDDVRRIALDQLQRLGHETVEASDAQSALDVLQRDQRFDLLFTDVVLRGSISGIELRAVVRRLLPHLPVLFTSGFPDLRQLGFPLGSDDLLIGKPYRRHELAQKIREALARIRRTA
jgi:PAS domain S-box-containing protein